MLRYLLQRPIAVSMTLFVSLANVVGLIPFLIGGQNEVFWFALAVGPVGGTVGFSAILFYHFTYGRVYKK
jgi:F0F1-type ATP synthase membrane subunit a